MTEKKSPCEIARERIAAREAAEAERDAESLQEAAAEAARLAARDRRLRALLGADNALTVLRELHPMDADTENAFVARMERPCKAQLSLPAFLLAILEEYDIQTNRNTLSVLVQEVAELFETYDLGARWVEKLEATLLRNANLVDAAIDRLSDDKGSDIRHDHINPSKSPDPCPCTIEVPNPK